MTWIFYALELKIEMQGNQTRLLESETRLLGNKAQLLGNET